MYVVRKLVITIYIIFFLPELEILTSNVSEHDLCIHMLQREHPLSSRCVNPFQTTTEARSIHVESFCVRTDLLNLKYFTFL
jgi:hypothetical protein